MELHLKSDEIKMQIMLLCAIISEIFVFVHMSNHDYMVTNQNTKYVTLIYFLYFNKSQILMEARCIHGTCKSCTVIFHL